jgi:hypothetical protein
VGGSWKTNIFLKEKKPNTRPTHASCTVLPQACPAPTHATRSSGICLNHSLHKGVKSKPACIGQAQARELLGLHVWHALHKPGLSGYLSQDVTCGLCKLQRRTAPPACARSTHLVHIIFSGFFSTMCIAPRKRCGDAHRPRKRRSLESDFIRSPFSGCTTHIRTGRLVSEACFALLCFRRISE